MKIKITVPKMPNGKWQLQVGKGNIFRRDVVSAYNTVERKLKKYLASSTPLETVVCVNYDQVHGTKNDEWINEGKYTNAEEALYVLACFLEDYLPEALLHEKERKYQIT